MFLSYYILSSEDKGNRNLNGAGLWPSLQGRFNDGHFAGEMTRGKLGRLDWRTRLRSKWSDLNYMCAPRAAVSLEFVPHLQLCICTGPYSRMHTHRHTRTLSHSHTHTHTHTHRSSLNACTHLQNEYYYI